MDNKYFHKTCLLGQVKTRISILKDKSGKVVVNVKNNTITVKLYVPLVAKDCNRFYICHHYLNNCNLPSVISNRLTVMLYIWSVTKRR